MKPATRARALEIFKRALEVSDAERGDFVRSQCRDDDELSRAVDLLFSADETPNPLLERRVGASVADLALPRVVPDRVGRYEIVREIDSGGMGTVYEAWQDHPRRRVALKTLRGRLQTADGLRRFRFEAEVLGSLRHPAIAQVYESGTHPGERETPYIAMEYVPGARHLVDYVEERSLDRRARIELFLRVAEAVHHGHLSGVIHRDLKPSNILVDESGAPKVIDFGLARASAPELEGLSLAETRTGQLLGTVQYMSPEQLSGELERVDLRSDVHALGVVLFQLLGGELPHDLRDLPLAQMARVVAEEEPRRLGALDPALAGDLEWIVAKALEKDPERRYASVSELAADLRRHLDHEPVLAGPPGGWYRARKFARRHRVALAVAAVFAAVLLASAGSIWQRTVEARTQLEIASEANGFLERMLSSVQPRHALGQEVTLREFVDQAAAELEEAPPARPEVEASVRRTLAETYAAVGRHDLAQPQARGAWELLCETVGARDERALAALNAYTLNTIQLGYLDRAEELSSAALESARALSADHPEAVRAVLRRAKLLSALGRYEEAEDEYRRALAAAGSPELVRAARTGLFTLLGDTERYEEAAEVLRQIIAGRPPDRSELDPQAITEDHNLGALLALGGEIEAALEVYDEVLERLARAQGDMHPQYLGIAADRVTLLLNTGQRPDAEIERLLASLAEVRGRESAADLHAMKAMGEVLIDLRRTAEAIELLSAALEASRRGSSEPTVDYFRVAHNLGNALIRSGRYERAEDVLLPAAEEALDVLGPESWLAQQVRNNLAVAWFQLGRLDEAAELFDSVLAENTAAHGDDHPVTLQALLNRGALYGETGELERAEELLSAAVERHERVHGHDHPQTQKARQILAGVRERADGG